MLILFDRQVNTVELLAKSETHVNTQPDNVQNSSLRKLAKHWQLYLSGSIWVLDLPYFQWVDRNILVNDNVPYTSKYKNEFMVKSQLQKYKNKMISEHVSTWSLSLPTHCEQFAKLNNLTVLLKC